MISLQQIEQDLTSALKARNQLLADTLRGLKNRIMNEKISKMKDLEDADMVALVKSEIKRRKEASQAFLDGNRPELSAKELEEAKILEQYLPPQMSESQAGELVDKIISENGFSAKDFGQAMGKLKAAAGQQVDGALLAKLLKEKLK